MFSCGSVVISSGVMRISVLLDYFWGGMFFAIYSDARNEYISFATLRFHAKVGTVVFSAI